MPKASRRSPQTKAPVAVKGAARPAIAAARAQAPVSASPPDSRGRADAALLCLLALAVRLPNLGWGLPNVEEEALPMKKAFEMWGWDAGRVNFNPQTVGWPSLSFYVHLLLQKLYYLAGRMFGTFENRLDYYVEFLVDNSRLVVISRLVGVLAAVGTVYVAWRVAARLTGRFGGILVGLLLALSPMLVEHAQQITPDILLVFFSAAAGGRLVDIYERGRVRDYVWAAVWIALGAASKYTPVLLTGVLYATHLMRRHAEGRSLKLLGIEDRRLWLAALFCALVFCATSPYLFTDMSVLKRDFGYQAMHMKQGHFGQDSHASGYWYYVSKVLPHALGLPALVLGVVGLGWAGLRLRGRWTVVLLSGLVFYAVLGALSTRFDRYMLPVLMPLALGVAGLWAVLQPRLARVSGRARRATAAGLGLITVGPATWGTLEYHRVESAPSTQWLTKQYVTQELPRDRNFFAAELYTIELPSTEVQEQIKSSIVYLQMSERQRHRLLDMRTYEYTFLPMYSTRVQLSAFYYDLRHFEVYDYLLTSGAVRRRYEANPSRFPQQVQFYKDLDTYAELVKDVAPHGRNRGPEIRIYRLTDVGKQRLIADRGRLAPRWYLPYVERLHAPHFTAFLESVGGHCYARGRFDLADRFYEALLETSTPADRARWLFRLGYVKMQTHQIDAAAPLFEEYLRSSPDDGSALANLGLLYVRQGKIEQGRGLLQKVASLDPAGQLAGWAREQLARLDRGAGSEDASAPPAPPGSGGGGPREGGG
jgi:tetratricopeptide (TPR) repeat protein